MKKFALAAALVAFLMGATPLTAAHRRYAECRIVHPAYYYQSHGHRAHGKYRVGHYTRYHVSRFDGRRRFDNRYRYDWRYRDEGRYRYDWRYRDDGRYRYDRRRYDPYRRVYPPDYRRRGHRPRVGIYLEF